MCIMRDGVISQNGNSDNVSLQEFLSIEREALEREVHELQVCDRHDDDDDDDDHNPRLLGYDLISPITCMRCCWSRQKKELRFSVPDDTDDADHKADSPEMQKWLSLDPETRMAYAHDVGPLLLLLLLS